jgi:hypothetical protein
MASVAEEYVLLALRLGRHVEGLVDFYFGPPALAAEVGAEPLRSAARLVEDGGALAARIATEGGSTWLAEQVHGLMTYARVLSGEGLSYADEVEGCYGVRPRLEPESTFETAHAALAQLLPGEGDVVGRITAWRSCHAVPAAALPSLIDAILPVLREKTRSLVELPHREAFVVEYVADKPWAAFNYYLGDRLSRIAINTDIPLPVTKVLELAAHEAYPGHHTEHLLKEVLLVDGRGLIEESIAPVPTPQALVAEGIACVAQDLALEDDVILLAVPILERHGLRFDPDHVREVADALRPLGLVQTNAALLVHDHGLSPADAVASVARWSGRSLDQARQSVRFVTDPTWRAYATTYTDGERLCRAFVDRHPADGFRRLLTEQVPVSELAAICETAIG